MRQSVALPLTPASLPPALQHKAQSPRDVCEQTRTWRSSPTSRQPHSSSSPVQPPQPPWPASPSPKPPSSGLTPPPGAPLSPRSDTSTLLLTRCFSLCLWRNNMFSLLQHFCLTRFLARVDTSWWCLHKNVLFVLKEKLLVAQMNSCGRVVCEQTVAHKFSFLMTSPGGPSSGTMTLRNVTPHSRIDLKAEKFSTPPPSQLFWPFRSTCCTPPPPPAHPPGNELSSRDAGEVPPRRGRQQRRGEPP